MSELDLAILACIGISTFLGFLRGVIRAATGLLKWLAAIVVTLVFANRFASLLPIDGVDSPLARATISAFILFFGTLAVGTIISWFLERIFPRAGLTRIDRGLGVGFGFARGLVIVTLLVLAANLVPELKQETWWSESRLVSRFQSVAKFLHARLPDSIGQHFDVTANSYREQSPKTTVSFLIDTGNKG